MIELIFMILGFMLGGCFAAIATFFYYQEQKKRHMESLDYFLTHTSQRNQTGYYKIKKDYEEMAEE